MKNPVVIGPADISLHKKDILRIEDRARLTSGATVIFSPVKKGVYTFSLINLQGRTVLETAKWCDTETSQVFLGKSCASGAYFIRIRNEKQVISNRAILIR